MAAGDIVNGWVITMHDHEYDRFKRFYFTNPDVIKEKISEVMEYFISYQFDISDISDEYCQSIIDYCLKEWDPSMDVFNCIEDPEDLQLDIFIHKATLEYELKLKLKEQGWQHLTKSVSKS